MSNASGKNKDPYTYSSRKKEIKSKIGPDLDFASQEAYNMLRSSLEFVCVDTQMHGKAVGITSSAPQEGKSVTAANVAYALAKKGFKTLLVDGDLRRPTIHKLLKLNRRPGLSNNLAEGNDMVVRTKVLHDNLSVITAGDIPPNPSELIASKRMKSTLLSLRNLFDYVIVDLPPVNSVSDAFAISPLLDGIILVVRHKTTRRSDLAEAYRQLEFANANILGVVYNGYGGDGGYYSQHKSKYYQKKYGYKNYGYGYGYYGQKPETDEKK